MFNSNYVDKEGINFSIMLINKTWAVDEGHPSAYSSLYSVGTFNEVLADSPLLCLSRQHQILIRTSDCTRPISQPD